MSSKKAPPQKLGRGLKALFNDHQVLESEDGSISRVEEVPLNKITPNPFQPREVFDDEEIDELAKTIDQHGLLSPIVVRKHEDGFQIVLGERRFRAHQKLGKHSIKAEIKDKYTDKQMAEVALIENIQRVQLSPIEEAHAFEQLINEHAYTHEQVAERVGKSRSAVSNTLRLTKLPEEVQLWIKEEKLSAGHARALLGSDVDDPIAMARQIIDGGLNVRETENATKSSSSKLNKREKVKDPNVVNFERELEYALGTSVDVAGNTKKGKITITFTGSEDLERITQIIKNGSELI
ncbi:MAG: ParB/RepB/Spo0J family partition protein [Fibrobacterales bacterium]